MVSSIASVFLRSRFHLWLPGSDKAEKGEIQLHRRRVFIIPTRAGLAYALMLLILFIGSVNYNLSLGFGLTFLLAACAVIDMHLTFRNLAYLHLAPGRVKPVFAGGEALFDLQLSNRNRHDRYAIWLGFTGKEAPGVEQAVDIPAHSTRSLMLATPARQRGLLSAPRIRIQTRFPLGLLRAWSYWQPDMQVLVYPQPEPSLQPLPVAGGGNEDGNGSAGHDDFAGVRPYQSGDSLKQLAWRQMAKMDNQHDTQLITKLFEGGAASELLLDFSLLPASLDLESRLSRMTRWVLEAEAMGMPYGFRLGNIEFAAALGPSHQAACLQELALYKDKGRG